MKPPPPPWRTLSPTDVRILEKVAMNGRATASAIAEELDLSASTVTRRLRRLESVGVIKGYVAIIDQTVFGYGLEALVEIRFMGKTRPAEMAETIRQLPEVLAVFTTTGNFDALAWMRLRDAAHLRETIDELRLSSGVVDTRTHLVLASTVPPMTVTDAP